jgi:hypothetical protein
MNHSRALALLIAGNINTMLAMKHDDELPGCCRIHCGPCAALHWLGEKLRAWTYGIMRELRDPDTGEPEYDWQTEQGGLDWVWLAQQWDAWPGCSSVGGVRVPCVEGDDD